MSTPYAAALRSDLLEAFRWVDGHADVWRFFSDGELFARIVAELAAPFRAAQATKVAGIESRGFILGAAVAHELGVGFVAVRRAEALFPGEKLERRTAPDYRGRELVLRIQRAAVAPGDRVVIVDDWFQTGQQGLAVKALLADASAELIGTAVIVDQLAQAVRTQFKPYHALLRADELPAT